MQPNISRFKLSSTEQNCRIISVPLLTLLADYLFTLQCWDFHVKILPAITCRGAHAFAYANWNVMFRIPRGRADEILHCKNKYTITICIKFIFSISSLRKSSCNIKNLKLIFYVNMIIWDQVKPLDLEPERCWYQALVITVFFKHKFKFKYIFNIILNPNIFSYRNTVRRYFYNKLNISMVLEIKL